jgi:hypothetical protein
VILGEDSLDEEVFYALQTFNGKKVRLVGTAGFRDPTRTD